MWTDTEQRALQQTIQQLSHRFEVDELLGRCYGLRSSETHNRVEYSGPNVGGRLYVRYHDDCVVSVAFVEAS